MRTLNSRYLFVAILGLFFFQGHAQENLGDLFKVDYDTPLTIDIDAEQEEDEVRDLSDWQEKEEKRQEGFSLALRPSGVSQRQATAKSRSWSFFIT